MSTNLYDVAVKATRTFRSFEEGAPELIKLGIPAVDTTIGGVGPGTLVVVALPTGVGKSSTALHMLLHSPDRGGYCSMEDPEDLFGARLLAAYSGVSSLRIRRKDLDEHDLRSLRDGMDQLARRDEEGRSPVLDFLIGKSIVEVEKAVERQAAAGCRFGILDYLQKLRGVSEDRRSEVGAVMGRYQGACYEHGMAAIMLSQFSRLDPGQRPRLRHLKESGDIENEARVVILGWQDPKQARLIRFCLEKSTYGGAGLEWCMHYDSSGTLRDGEPEEDDGEELF